MLIWVHSVTALKGPEDNGKDEMTLPPGLQMYSWSALYDNRSFLVKNFTYVLF